MLHVDELPIEALYPSLFRREGNIEFGVFSHQVDDDLRSQVAASWDELGAKTFSTLSASGSLTRVQLLILRADLGRLELEAAAVLRSLVTS